MLTFYDAKELWTIKIRQLQRAYLDTQLFSLFLKREREIIEMEENILELLKMQKNY